MRALLTQGKAYSQLLGHSVLQSPSKANLGAMHRQVEQSTHTVPKAHPKGGHMWAQRLNRRLRCLCMTDIIGGEHHILDRAEVPAPMCKI